MTGPVLGNQCRLRVFEGSVGHVLEGLTISTWKILQDVVDISTAGDLGWRKLLSEAGSRSIEIEARGVHFGSVAEDRVRDAAIQGRSLLCELFVNANLSLRGEFIVVRLSYNAPVDEEAGYEVHFRSAGAIAIA